ncbi:MAG: Fe-S cluster assembly protein NifU [Armatimonadota bacterium]
MWEYSETLKDHFYNPRNVGEIEDPDADAQVGSLTCGDALRLMLKLDENEVITDAKFQTFGCGSAIASASALTEMIIGKPLSQAAQITHRDIAEYLGGLPEEKIHCSVMGHEALEKAIAIYRGETPPDEDRDEGRIVCRCFGVTDTKIRRIVKENRLRSVQEVTNYTKAGGGCMSCHPQIEDIIAEVWGDLRERGEAPPARPRLTNIQKIALIQEHLEKDIAPALRADGGDVELIDVDGDHVQVALRGACADCPSSRITVKAVIEARLRELVSDALVVEEVEA